MIGRHLHFETARPLDEFPRPFSLGMEVRTGPDYHWEGRTRGDSPHAIFQYTLEGCGRFRDRNGEHRLPPGTGFLCISTDPEIAYYYAPDEVRPWAFFFLAFSGAAAYELVNGLTRRFGGVFSLPPDKGIVKRLRGLLTESRQVLPLTVSSGTELVMELLCAIAASREEAPADHPEERLVERAKEEIERRLEARINAAGLADVLAVSREHLSRVFKRRTGWTPYQYVLRRQMLHACHLLTDPAVPVKEIAARLGFDAPGSFGRTFERLLGMSPARFRKSGSLPVLL